MINICMLSIELDILHNRIEDICSFYAVQVLLSPMVSDWAVGQRVPSGRAGLVLTCLCCIS